MHQEDFALGHLASGMEVSRLSHALDTVFGLLKPLLPQVPVGVGGVFLVLDESGQELHREEIGSINPSHIARLWELAFEKARRLLENFLTGRHVSSWQSRDAHCSKLGGAIVVKGGILCFSGLHEHADESLMLCVGLLTGLLTRMDAEIIASYSQNKLFLKSSDAMEAAIPST